MLFHISKNAHRLSIALDGLIDLNFKFNDEIINILNSDESIAELIFILRKLRYKEETDIDILLNELKKIADKNFEITIIECPKNILDYLIKNHAKANIKTIRSFMIPYYCNSCNEEKHQLINTSCLTLSFNAYKKPLCPACNKQLSLDITDTELLNIAKMLPVLDKISDKRNFPRYEIESYNLFLEIYLDNKIEKFKILNFSQEGLSISGDIAILPGTTFTYVFKHHGKEIKSSGTVVWYSSDSNFKFIHGVNLEDKELYGVLMVY